MLMHVPFECCLWHFCTYHVNNIDVQLLKVMWVEECSKNKVVCSTHDYDKNFHGIWREEAVEYRRQVDGYGQ